MGRYALRGRPRASGRRRRGDALQRVFICGQAFRSSKPPPHSVLRLRPGASPFPPKAAGSGVSQSASKWTGVHREGPLPRPCAGRRRRQCRDAQAGASVEPPEPTMGWGGDDQTQAAGRAPAARRRSIGGPPHPYGRSGPTDGSRVLWCRSKRSNQQRSSPQAAPCSRASTADGDASDAAVIPLGRAPRRGANTRGYRLPPVQADQYLALEWAIRERGLPVAFGNTGGDC